MRLRAEEQVIRVEQSALLNSLRKGVPVPELGHPELNNALAYVRRCRNAIDVELFNLFSPRARCWAVNGTAGMGKSVLLAYTLFVFASDRRVVISDPDKPESRTLEDFSSRAAEIGLPAVHDRVIYATARKEKQLDALRFYWDLFVERYSRLSDRLGLQTQQPIFQKWGGGIPEDCNVLLIDEAHDLDITDQSQVASWLNAEETTRYLAIACDRHQKLKLVGTDAVLMRD